MAIEHADVEAGGETIDADEGEKVCEIHFHGVGARGCFVEEKLRHLIEQNEPILRRVVHAGAVSVDHDRLFALAAAVGGDRVEVKSCISAQMPETVDRRDGAAVGAWLGTKLRDAGVGRSRLVFAATRGEVDLRPDTERVA